MMMSFSYRTAHVRQVAFLLLPEFSNLGIAAAIEPLFIANWLAHETLFEWKLISTDGKPVRASNGMPIAVDGNLESAGNCKTVFVVASFDPRESLSDRRIVRWLRRIARFGVEIGGLETGAAVLAEAGLLNGHDVAIHWDNLMGFQQNFPATRAVAHLYTRRGERITCAGAAATLDLMLAWIGWHGEPGIAHEVAAHLLLGKVRDGETEQNAPTAGGALRLHRLIAAAQDVMQDHIEEPLSCREVARRAGLSLRQLERHFRQELGCSLLQHYRQIRMAKAHQLLQQTALSVTEIAFACGFSSPEYFCRLYRGQFGCSPSRDRRQSPQAPALRQLSDLPTRGRNTRQ